MDGQGVMYVIDQLGVALAEANRQIDALKAEILRLAPPQEAP